MTTDKADPIWIRSLAEVLDRFDTFLIDQFGVLHDGLRPYDGAVEGLVALKKAGKRVVLLSNSGKRSAANAKRLLALGFQEGSWDHLVTSGEVAWGVLKQKASERTGLAPLRCLLLARGGDTSAIEGLPIEITQDGKVCDFVLIAGSDGDRFPLDHYRALLAPAAARRAPSYCTNPDKLMLTPQGLSFGAGHIAEIYGGMGGRVEWIGKPYPEIYKAALTLVGNPPSGQVLCIGDSLEHDIAGGRGAGLATCFIAGGIHHQDDRQELMKRLADEHSVENYVMEKFTA